MRPTLLNFRSPKERTPFYFDSSITYDGRNLSFNSPKGSGKTGTFSYEKRFNWYKNLKGSSYPAGPGSYSPICTRSGKARISSVVPYRKLYGLKDDSSKGYEMVGDQIVPDVELMLKVKVKPKFGSDAKLSTKLDSFEQSSNLVFSKRFTPDPVISRYLKEYSRERKVGTLQHIKKFRVFNKVEKLLQKRNILGV